MLFHTPLYLGFLTIAVLVYWLLPQPGWRRAWLLFSSYTFYALFDWRFAVLLLGFSLAIYAIGAAIPASAHPRRWLALGLASSLGLLALFKYTNFFLDSLRLGAASLGITLVSPVLTWLLPVGISFYTFQAISYLLEIHRQRLQPASSLADFVLYLAFFPKLVAGPVIRPAQFFNQLRQPQARLSGEQLQAALALLLLGLVKKVVIADALAGPAAVAFRAAAWDPAAGAFPSPLYIQGFYLFAFQIYADFSGYTDIARASAQLLGFNLPENFQQPYLSTTITQFWNRWHISLTQWFRENLFFPLSRAMLSRAKRRAARPVQITANFVTMLVIGLWHGAAWTFVAWGAWHGLLLTLEQLRPPRPAQAGKASPVKDRLGALLGGVLTFHLVALGWVLFRSVSFAAAWRFFQGLFAFEQMYWLPYYLPSIVLTGAFVFAIDLVASGRLPLFSGRFRFLRHVLVIAALTLLAGLWLVAFTRGASASPFIYGSF